MIISIQYCESDGNIQYCEIVMVIQSTYYEIQHNIVAKHIIYPST